MSDELSSQQTIDSLRYWVHRYETALEEIANANAKANLSARDCEYIARKALGWDTSRIYPTDY